MSTLRKNSGGRGSTGGRTRLERGKGWARPPRCFTCNDTGAVNVAGVQVGCPRRHGWLARMWSRLIVADEETSAELTRIDRELGSRLDSWDGVR